MPMFECLCVKCKKVTEKLIKIGELDGWYSDCDECDGVVERIEVQSRAPALHSSDYHTNIAKMKQASKERFVSKEIDDVRHKFGRNFDDGLVGAAADRIKSGL